MINSPEARLRYGMCAAAAATLLLVCSCSSSSSSSEHSQASGGDAVTPSVEVADDAPWTPLVTSLVQAMTLTEKLTLVEGAMDSAATQGTGVVPAIARLGIPSRHDADALAIYATGTTTTSIPIRLAMASSFDRSALESAGKMVGAEGRAAGVDMVYGPQLDIARVSNWSRNDTTPGEDPFLNGELGAYEINGIQGAGLMSCVKHVAFYSGQAGSAAAFSSADVTTPSTYTVLDDQTAHELYLENYRRALVQAAPASEMCSYQAEWITGQMVAPAFSCHNGWLQNTVIRGQWDWRGFIVSDYGGAHYGDVLNGLDEEFATTHLGPSSTWYQTISSYADQLQGLDQAVARILYQYERFGLLKCASASGAVSGCSLDARPSMSDLAAADWAVSQKLAEEGAVLLKNDGGLLPLTSSDLSGGILVVGPTARQLMNATGERSKGFPERNMISPLQKLQELAGAGASITYLPGIDWQGSVIGSASDTTAAAYKLTGSFTVADSGSTGVAATSVDGHAVPTGGTTTVTGTITAPTAGKYYIWLRGKTLSAAGSGYLSAHYLGYGVASRGSSAGSTATLSIGDSTVTLSALPVEPETFWSSGLDGYVSIGALVTLAQGDNAVTAVFNAASLSATDFPDGLHVKLSYSSPDATRAAAVAAAATAHRVIVFGNTGGTAQPTESTDVVPNLDTNENALIEAIAAVNSHTVVVLNNNNPVAMPWLHGVASLLVMWYPGQEGGVATANLLLGNVNPGGRLPITFPANSGDTPFGGGFYAIRQGGVLDTQSRTYSQLTEGLFSGYRWYDQMDIEPMFAFGEGLSYTTFAYSGLTVTRTTDGFQAKFTVKNTGSVAGAVVPQLYVGATNAALPSGTQQARKTLVGFDRVVLSPGQSTTVKMTVTGHQLSYWSTNDQAWVQPGGVRAVYVSDSARDSAIQLTSSVSLDD